VEGDPELAGAFAEAAARIRAAATNRKSVPPGMTSADRLELYALYKQATAGDAPENGAAAATSPSPANSFFVGAAKFAAWRRCAGMSSRRAAAEYVAAAERLLSPLEEGAPSPTSSTTNASSSSSSPAEELIGSTDGGVGVGGNVVPGGPAVSRPMVDLDEEGGTGDGGRGDDPAVARLLRAAANDDVGAIRELLLACAGEDDLDVNCTDGDGQTALHMAADRGGAEAVRVLLHEFGADPRASDGQGITALHAAVIAGRRECCRLLLDAGADPDQPDGDGETPRQCCADDDGELKKLLDAAAARNLLHSCSFSPPEQATFPAKKKQ
jgi:acyl-CoA-binding protein